MFSFIRNKIYSILKITEKDKYKYECIKISFIYLIIGSLWVYFSDRLASKLTIDNGMFLYLSTYKGWLFVVITSVILYLLVSSLIKKVNTVEMKLNESYEELAASNEELQAYVQQLTSSDEMLRKQYDQITESEKKLSASEGKNKAIIKALPDLLFLIDDHGYFTDCVANDESVLLLPKEDFIGKAIYNIVPEEISEKAYEKMKNVLEFGVMEVFDYKMHISGKEYYFELRMVKNNDREIMAISRDITDKRQSEMELKMSEERYKTLINEMQQGVSLYEADFFGDDVRNYRLVSSNESHERIMELCTEDIKGKTISELLPFLGGEILETLSSVVKTGESQQYQHYYQVTNKYYEVIAFRPKRLQLAIIVNDITLRKNFENELVVSEHNFRNLFDNSSDPILIIQEGILIDCNLAAVEYLGYETKVFLVGKNPVIFSPEVQANGEGTREKAFEIYMQAKKYGKYKFEWWFKKSDGTLLTVEIMLTSIYLNGKKVFHCLVRDIGDHKQMEAKLEYLGYHDQLTGLYNRRYFNKEIINLDTENNLPISIIIADVNGLKLVNDSFGHNKGDELLVKVVEVMKRGLREKDIIARLAGDEFIILSPNTHIIEAEQIVNNIKVSAQKEKVENIDISISFGYQTKTSREENIEDILKKAEDNMYKNKLFEGPSMRGKTINTIISALHEKNKREEQHSYRVSKLCKSMGKALVLSEDEVKELETVGLLHDIGKIAIEENLLNKPGRLDDDEYEIVKRHPEIGYRILSTVNDLAEMAEYVLAHHERYDGKGYPKGLKGEAIPLQSRIITIVDAYDAMVSERSYRNPLPEEVAIGELRRNAGTQFDSDLVNVFIEEVLCK